MSKITIVANSVRNTRFDIVVAVDTMMDKVENFKKKDTSNFIN